MGAGQQGRGGDAMTGDEDQGPAAPAGPRVAARPAITAVPTRTFEGFYREEHRSIASVVMVLVGDRAVADDIVQEAFATAYRRWSTIGEYDRPGAWVRRVAVNHAISRLRRRRAESRALRRVGTGDDSRPGPEAPNEALWAAIRALPRRQAQAVALTYGDDLSMAEVADILGCSVGAVKTHLSRARSRLAEELRDQRPVRLAQPASPGRPDRPEPDGGAAHV
jgi:RNA polymerase sigma-70 factor (sigma-E family)